jgi:hypothetical protein
MDSVSKKFVEEFLMAHGFEYDGIMDGKDVWVNDEGVIVQLATGHGRIDLERFESIATDQVGIPYWEFDYVLGQNGYPTKKIQQREETKETREQEQPVEKPEEPTGEELRAEGDV